MGIHRRQHSISHRRGISVAIYLILCIASIAADLRLGAFLLAAAMHESGHIAAAHLIGAQITDISVGPLGVRMRYSDFGIGCFASCMICAAGGLVGILSAAVVLATPLSHIDAAMHFALLSACLAAVNLLPIRTLDGGAVLYLVLERRLLPHRAAAIADAISVAASAAFFVVSVYICFTRSSDISLLLISGYFIFASVLKA